MLALSTTVERAVNTSAGSVEQSAIREALRRDAIDRGFHGHLWFDLNEIMHDLAQAGPEYLGHFVARFDEVAI
jgi:hypothetical protein